MIHPAASPSAPQALLAHPVLPCFVSRGTRQGWDGWDGGDGKLTQYCGYF
jgi:hypothetical protein